MVSGESSIATSVLPGDHDLPAPRVAFGGDALAGVVGPRQAQGSTRHLEEHLRGRLSACREELLGASPMPGFSRTLISPLDANRRAIRIKGIASNSAWIPYAPVLGAH